MEMLNEIGEKTMFKTKLKNKSVNMRSGLSVATIAVLVFLILSSTCFAFLNLQVTRSCPKMTFLALIVFSRKFPYLEACAFFNFEFPANSNWNGGLTFFLRQFLFPTFNPLWWYWENYT